jgi:hypothetical protein
MLNSEGDVMKILTATFVLLILTITVFAADISTIEVTGSGIIEATDTAKARDDAFDDAAHKAIRQSVLTLLPPALAAEKSAILEDKIFPRPGGYLTSIEVIKEGASTNSPNSYEITAKAGISTATLLKDLAALGITPQKKGYPRLLVLIEQKNIDEMFWHRQTPKLNDAESKVRDALWTVGFPFIDQAVFIKGLSESREKAIYDGDIDTLINIGRLNDAQVVIFGRAVSSRLDMAANSGAMASIDATVLLRAVRVDDGQTITTYSGRSSQVHVDALVGGALAISRAAEDAANQIAGDIIREWTTNQPSGLRITLVVNGLQSDAELSGFKADFQTRMKGVKSLEKRTYSGGTAAFDLVTGYNCDDIIDQLSLQGLNFYTVRVRSKSPSYLELNVKAK